MILQPKAFIFDLNGTMVNDMDYHTRAWYQVLNQQLGADITYADLEKEMYGKNAELLVRIFGPDRFSAAETETLSAEKEKQYQQGFLPHLQLIAGLDHFLQSANAAGIRLAIGSAAIMDNIKFVIDNMGIRHYFGALVSADEVAVSKPDPETFLKAAAMLGVAPADCVVFEDAPKGIEAAANAGMQSVAITTMHAREEFAGYSNIICFIEDYNDPALNGLLHPWQDR